MRILQTVVEGGRVGRTAFVEKALDCFHSQGRVPVHSKILPGLSEASPVSGSTRGPGGEIPRRLVLE